MKLAMYQLKAESSLKSNIEKAMNAIKTAAGSGADMILFPELQLTEFMPQYPGKKMQPIVIDDNIIKRFRAACAESSIWAVPNVYLSEGGRNYDASIMIDAAGNIVGVQKMVHIAQAAQFYEQDYYEPADDGFKVFDTPFGKIGMIICFDRHYPESIRTEALMGAGLILIPTANTKSEPSDMFEWEIRVQAFQNSTAVAMCNRVGREDQMDFSGESIIADAEGNVVIKGGSDEGILYGNINPEMSAEIRQGRPYTNLRRKEFYK